MKPNLFNFATSELSQDAFLCWLLAWGDKKYDGDNGLKSCAKELLLYFVDNKYTKEIETVDITRQWNKIDIKLEINNELVIIIEDKTNTGPRKNQLSDYKEIAEKYYRSEGSKKTLSCVFLKTGNFSVTDELRTSGYNIVNRTILLDILKKHNSTSDIYNHFRDYLEEIETRTNSYLNKPLHQWIDNNGNFDFYCYQGFYIHLQRELAKRHNRVYTWGYVPSMSGGFWGMWESNINIQGERPIYVQLQNCEVHFKLGVTEGDKGEQRNEWHKLILDCAKEKGLIEIVRPKRLSIGTTMTIAVVTKEDFMGNKICTVDFDEIIDKIKKYHEVVDSCVKKAKA